MRSATCLFAVVCVCACRIIAFPSAAPGDDEWLPINPADLALKDNPASPGSHAMILYRQEFTDASNAASTEYYRVKIFTEEGKQQGDVEIPFVKGRDTIEDIRARTVRPDGTVIPFTGQVFEKEIVKAGGIKVLEKTFTMPDVQPGCIIEYKYKVQRDRDFFWNVGWSVQQDLFTREADFSIHPPGGAFAPATFAHTVGLGQPVKPEKQKNGDYTLVVHNIPGLPEEDYMLPKEMLRGRVEFIFKPATSSPQTSEEYWKQTDKKINDSVENYVNRKGALQQIVAAATTSSDSPEAKLRKLYARVQTIRNLSYEDRTNQEWKRQKIQENNNVEDVLKRNYGYTREINDVFIGLARAAGFEANQVLIAPRDQRFFFPNFQDVSELDDDVVLVKLAARTFSSIPPRSFIPLEFFPGMKPASPASSSTKKVVSLSISPSPRAPTRSPSATPPYSSAKTARYPAPWKSISSVLALAPSAATNARMMRPGARRTSAKKSNPGFPPPPNSISLEFLVGTIHLLHS